MNNQLMFSSRTDLCSTPQDFFDALNAEFHFDFDVCASEDNHKCEEYWDRSANGLDQAWEGRTFWMNPPYGRQIGKWVKKAFESPSMVVGLLPARTDTAWWHTYIWDESKHDWREGVEGRFIRGRLKFGGLINSAPFPSAVVLFMPNPTYVPTPERTI